MAENSKIQWTDHTFNPWIGCTKVSPGCDHCYAEAREDKRLHRVAWGPGQARHRTKTWGDPVRWNRESESALDAAMRAAMATGKVEHRRPRVFCASLADVFDNEVPPDWRGSLFRLIHATPMLDWLLLTKRIGNARLMIDDALADARLSASSWPWPHVWLGATVVNQEEADRDIPKLLATPAAVRFLSIEPILGAIDLGDWLQGWKREHAELRGIDWMIVGGESGNQARPTPIGWIRSLVRQCQAAGVPAFVKQLGAHPVNREGVPHPLQHPKGGDQAEWPEDLRVREFPTTAGAVNAT